MPVQSDAAERRACRLALRLRQGRERISLPPPSACCISQPSRTLRRQPRSAAASGPRARVCADFGFGGGDVGLAVAYGGSLPRQMQGTDRVEVSSTSRHLSNQFGGDLPRSTASQAAGRRMWGRPTSQTGASNEAATTTGDRAANLASDNSISNAIAVHNANLRATNVSSFQAAVETRAATAVSSNREPLPNYEGRWDEATSRLRHNIFALLDVSTNADLYGVSFDWSAGREYTGPHARSRVTRRRRLARANRGDGRCQSGTQRQGLHPSHHLVGAADQPEPALCPRRSTTGRQLLPDDGGPTQILNNGDDTVALAPLPLTDYLIDRFEQNEKGFAAYALMTLPSV